MSRAKGNRLTAEKRARILRYGVDPENTPSIIGRLVGVSHVTVRKVLREAGLYIVRPQSKEAKALGHSVTLRAPVGVDLREVVGKWGGQ